jgi:endonuclease YncB( thermonuclease family)
LRLKHYYPLFLVGILLLGPNFAFASNFSAPVIAVIDGDTIEVLHDRHSERIRLNGIDCPEKGQAYGHKAKDAVADLVFGKQVILQTYGLDKYGRTIADVQLHDGTNVNQRLVKDGWCWWYRKYAPGNAELEKLEKDARDAKKGVWADSAPVPPWIYRKAKRGQALDLSDTMMLEADGTSKALSRAPPSLGIADLDPGLSSSPYPIIGNLKSRIYHRPDCPNYSQVGLKNRKIFNSEVEAQEAGYRVARNCP